MMDLTLIIIVAFIFSVKVVFVLIESVFNYIIATFMTMVSWISAIFQ